MNKINRKKTEKCDALTKHMAEKNKAKRDLQKAKDNFTAVMARSQEIVKKINEDQGQKEHKQKLRAQILLYGNVLPFIQE